MGRESVTFEQVSSAADYLISQNIKPTSRSVRDNLQLGSMTTILKYLQEWQATQARTTQVFDNGLDSSVVKSITADIANKVQQATSGLTTKIADIQGEMNTLIKEFEIQASELENCNMELSNLRAKNITLEERTSHTLDQNLKLNAELDKERKIAESQRVELAKFELKLEATQKLENDITNIRSELQQERSLLVQAQKDAAVAEAINIELRQRLSEITS